LDKSPSIEGLLSSTEDKSTISLSKNKEITQF